LDLSPAQLSKPRVAVLIDGDNYPRSGLAEVESKASRLGEITIRRVFGDMTQHTDWAQETGFVATHCATSAGKNRADIVLVIAAMDFAHRGLATAFAIVSDDRDFDPLISHMREQGYRAERIGKKKTRTSEVAPGEPKPSPAPSDKAMVKQVRAIIATMGSEGYPLQSLGVALHVQGLKIADTPQKTWRSWLNEHPDTFECDPRGPNARVRLKP
jgi:hypothetical protein